MSTYRELIYMCLDTLKITSDDSVFTEDHIVFLLNKYRSILLQQKYSDVRNPISSSNYQTLCLDLTLDDTKSRDVCKGTILRSVKKIPNLLNVGNTEVSLKDYYLGEVTLVSPNRLRYVGNNRWLQNVIYCTIGNDNYLYFKSSNPQHMYLEKVELRGIFEDPIEAAKLSCDKSSYCDILDTKMPLEESLVSKLIEVTVQYLSSGLYKPEDKENNASDDLSNLMAFIRNNMKSNLTKTNRRLMDNFRREVLKVDKPRVHKVKNSLGVYDAYKWLRKNKWLGMEPISEHDFYAIIRAMNKALAKNFLHLGSIKLPERMGEIILRKYPAKITLKNGKVQTNLPIDWDATLSLWSEDKDSYEKRTLIRAEEREIFKVLYDKSKALYNNKSFYTFELNRDIKISLKRQLKNGLLDAFMLCGKT